MINYIGHRGNSSIEVENSINAIRKCFDNDLIDGTEIDVRLSKDLNLVVIHNGKLNGISNKKGSILNYSYEELKNIMIKTSRVDKFIQYYNSILIKDRDYFRGYFGVGRKKDNICLLDSVLEILPQDKKLVIELKVSENEYKDEHLEYYKNSIIYLLKKHCDKNIVIQSFYHKLCLDIKKQLPNIKIGALISKRRNINCLDMGFDFISYQYSLINSTVVEELIKRNIELYTWDDKNPYKHFLYMKNIIKKYKDKINITLISDFPLKAREFIEISQ